MTDDTGSPEQVAAARNAVAILLAQRKGLLNRLARIPAHRQHEPEPRQAREEIRKLERTLADVERQSPGALALVGVPADLVATIMETK
jgi:hypothetical protein